MQANTSVHTMTLRACGLTVDQVVAIQTHAFAVDKKTRRRKRPRSTGAGGEDNVSGYDLMGGMLPESKQDPRLQYHEPLPEKGLLLPGDRLTWFEEKRLGFKASRLRDWLLDAAR